MADEPKKEEHEYDWDADDPNSWYPRYQQLRAPESRTKKAEATPSQTRREMKEFEELQKLLNAEIAKLTPDTHSEYIALAQQAAAGQPFSPEQLSRYNELQIERYQQRREFGQQYGEAVQNYRETLTSGGQTEGEESLREAVGNSHAKEESEKLTGYQPIESDTYSLIPDETDKPTSNDAWSGYAEVSPSSPSESAGVAKPPSGEVAKSGHPSGPWALEQTTQERLVEILEAIRNLGGGTGGSGGNGVPPQKKEAEEKEKSDYQKDKEAYEEEIDRRRRQREEQALGDELRKDISPMGGSGKNLFDYMQRVINTGRKFKERRAHARNPLVYPRRSHYDKDGKRLRSNTTGQGGGGLYNSLSNAAGQLYRKLKGNKAAAASTATKDAATTASTAEAVVAGAEEGAAAGPEGAVVGAAAGAAAGGGGSSPPSTGGGSANAGENAMMVGGAILGGPGGAAAATFVAAVMEFSKATYAFARAQENEIRRLAEVGPMQAAGIAILDAQRTMRDIQTARETGSSSVELTKSLSNFEEALRPIETVLTNIANNVGAGALDLLSELLQLIRPGVDTVVDIYNKIVEIWGGNKIDKPGQKADDGGFPAGFLKDLENKEMEQALPRWPAGPVNGRIG